MGIGKQAKILSEKQMRTALAYVSEHHRYPLRDRVMLLLSFKAGLRAKEIALATWSMVLNSDGVVGDTLELRNVASKGKGGGRVVPLNTELRAALVALHADRHPAPTTGSATPSGAAACHPAPSPTGSTTSTGHSGSAARPATRGGGPL